MKLPVWKLLVQRNIFEDRDQATRWLMAGKVVVNDHRIDKPGQVVDDDCVIRVKGLGNKYVSRGGLKLEGALHDFQIDVTNNVAIDAGASTGGFTDCLLQNGARLVYSVDVGFGQLAGSLRVNPKVRNMEKTNISDLSPDLLDTKPDIATMDLSYLSLKLAIPIVADLLPEGGNLICLVKPFYEVKDSDICRRGVIDDKRVYKDVLWDLIMSVKQAELSPVQITNSRILGSRGAREFFLLVSKSSAKVFPRELADTVDEVVGL